MKIGHKGIAGFLIIAAVVAGGGGTYFLWTLRDPGIPDGFAMTNGRLEALEDNVSAKLPGRLEEVLVDEGDLVERDQVVARMDTNVLVAQLAQAKAGVLRAEQEKNFAVAKLAQYESELGVAEQNLARARKAFPKGGISGEHLDKDECAERVARAAMSAGRASIAEAAAGIGAAEARVKEIEANIDDSILKAPRGGRVLYRVSEPGEVLPSGGRIITTIDLDDMFMYLFLSEREAGRLPMGAEARIVLDALPETPFPAEITFVAPKAQFTPKQVETSEERQKLVFRVKARLRGPPNARLKPGMPGVAYIRWDETKEWPGDLE